MELLIKASAISLISCLCALLIRNKNPEFSFLLAILCSASVLCAAIGMAGRLGDFLIELMDRSELSAAVFAPILKCVGIAVITKLCCELCRDAGQAAAQSAVEYLGTVAAVCTALPLLQSLLGILEGLL